MRKLDELFADRENMILKDNSFIIPGHRSLPQKKLKINILAMGDVGGTLALALKLCGADVVSRIGICDLNKKVVSRYEAELNQITMPFDYDALPVVVPVSPEEVFSGDVFLFCASMGVPKVQEKGIDVRMVQLDSNRRLVDQYAKQALEDGYTGEFFLVSDPVDPLCKAALDAGLDEGRIQGFGLGVMNGRAAYYAKRDPEFSQYLSEGRAFGPHGEDLVIADSLENYNDEISRRLTALTVSSNMKTRELGFKPYIAPAVSSGALSILENIRGHWHYSSAYFGKGEKGAFLGMKNRRCPQGLEVEDLPLDDLLFGRIENAYVNLEKLG
ncbi:MAG: lactate dehydrogenase [Anaerovoracaceae bacterium]|jgi:malate/lactate dehydrogenase